MIVIIGTPAEDPVRRLVDAARAEGVEALVLDETAAADWNLRVGSGPEGRYARLAGADGEVDLAGATGLYLRLTAPGRTGPVPDPLEQDRHDAAIALAAGWADVAAMRVANRPRAMASNGSKPYQAALIRSFGLAVPPTLVTNDPAAVQGFWDQHGRLVYKSASGVRSIVHELTPARGADLARVRHLPTQFQRLLEGTNVRVHVVGAAVFACEIGAATIDYRYREGGEAATMRAVELPPAVAERCVAVAAALDLPFAGIDLLRDDDGNWWCFEVNPSPAYSCFEEPTGLPIAAALARWLAGEGE
ncbi:MAG: hypothetical protein AAGC63_15995 [Propionicimonas sp.]|nr:hypothetical protein [Propionicimonas sp.]